jgi:SAM-dependent methyltransferase
MGKLTWEQAVTWLRREPDQAALVRACYYDDPLLDAATRFADSEEWRAVGALLSGSQGRALDLGAGRGIGSYALARDGWRVTALEPDPSRVVGAGAIRSLAREAGLTIEVVEQKAEQLPFGDRAFDVVYGRQILHHAIDLPALCREVFRVLKPRGRFIATREHVISRPEDLPVFLESHPLHKHYGGEHAYLLRDYRAALRSAGFRQTAELGPFDSVVNYFPMTKEEWLSVCRRPVSRWAGERFARCLVSDHHAPGRRLLKLLAGRLSAVSDSPGRLYSFVADKP